MIITTIGDEIGTTLEDQIEALKEVNMKYIEIRKINDIYIWEYSEEQIKQIKKEFEKNEIKVITIDTPIGKKKNSFNYDENVKLLDKYIKIANIFEAKYLRIFSDVGRILNSKSIKEVIREMSNITTKNKLNLLIKELQIEDCFILLGSKDNPYKYMKNCDIYVQASKKEGFGLTVVEAKILEKPIVCTKFNTAKELINNGIDGQIVEMNEEAIYLGIRKYIDDEEMTKKIIKELKSNHYNSIEEIRKFNEIINC